MNYHKPKTVSLINAQQVTITQSTKQWVIVTIASIVCTLIFLSLLSLHDITYWYKQQSAIKKLQQKLQNIQSPYQKYQTLMKQKEIITNHQEKITKYQNHKNHPIQTLNDCMQLLSKQLSYNQLTIGKKNIDIHLTASDMHKIHTFIAQLSSQENIQTTRITSIMYDNDAAQYTCCVHAKIMRA